MTTVGSAQLTIIPKLDNAAVRQMQSSFKSRMSSSTESLVPSEKVMDPGAGRVAGEHFNSSFDEEVKHGNLGGKTGSHVSSGMKEAGHHGGGEFAAGFLEAEGIEKAVEFTKDSIEEALTLNSLGKQMQATLGLTPEQAEKMGDVAGEAYSQAYGNSIEDVQGTVTALIQTFPEMKNASKEALKEATEDAQGFADSFHMSAVSGLQTARQLVSKGFAEDSSQAYDQLSALMQKIPTALQGTTMTAITRLAPYMKNLGLSSSQFMNLLLEGSANGSKGLMSMMRNFTSFQQNVAKGGKPVQDSFKTLGLNANSMAKQIAMGGSHASDAMKEIATRLLAVQNPATRASIAAKLFGTGISNLGATQLPAFLRTLQGTNNALGKTDGNMGKINKTAHETDAAVLKSLERSTKEAFGKALIPALEAVLPLFRGFATWLTKNEALVKNLAGPLLIIGTILAVIIAAVTIWNTIAPVFAAVTGIMTGAEEGFSASLLANPITWIILAIVALIAVIVLLVMHWKEVGKVFAGVGEAMLIAIVFIINGIIDAINALLLVLEAPFLVIGGVVSAVTGHGFSLPAPVLIPHIPMPAAPKFAKGGLIPATQGGYYGIFGEAGQSEIVMNEGVYNANSKAQTDLMDDMRTNGVGGRGSVVQNNTFNAVHMSGKQIEKVRKQRLDFVSGVY